LLTLAVDTTGDVGSVAVADESGVRDQLHLDAPRGFSMVLFGAIEALLKRQNLRLADIDVFAAASGPGSFTGVRVGLAAIKGLAEVTGKTAVGVSNLEALAEYGRSDARAAIIDAHRNEVYAALYDDRGNQLVPEMVGPFGRFVEMLPKRGIEWITQGFPLPDGLLGVEAPRTVAEAVAKIAIRRIAAGLTGDSAPIDANYVRRSDAEILWKES
jgi:tRNA threonylcarbamoyladenosine biosynthesis protein TsaB